MAETESPLEPALSSKRKPELASQDHENLPLKSQKLQTPDETIQVNEGNHSVENQTLEPSGKDDSSVPESIPLIEEPSTDAKKEDAEEEELDNDYAEDGGGGDDDDDDEDDEEENVTIDRKGKGILIEEENDSSDDDDDDDSSDGGNESDGESDLSDDPLAEVDLDNILPSRTRQGGERPGVYIGKDVGNNAEGDDSDDSDA